MRILAITWLITFFFLGNANAQERRCGWLYNPSPGNLLLTDRQGNWWISQQGRAEPLGMDKLPSLDDKEFVETNIPGSGHGYGCACLLVKTNNSMHTITHIVSGEALALARCRTDKALPKPN